MSNRNRQRKPAGEITLRLASAVRKARNLSGLSIMDLTVKSGIRSTSSIGDLESNCGVNFETAAKIAVALDLDLNAIVRGE